MKKNALGISLLPLLLLTGCTRFAAPLPPEPKEDENICLPPPPAEMEKSQPPMPKEAERKGQPLIPPPEPPALPPDHKMDSAALPPPPPPERPHSPEHFRRGQGIWRAFSQLSDKEKKELLELQRKSPDQFRTVMQAKADLLYEKERLRRQQMEEIARKCKKSGDAAEKEKLKAQLQSMVREDFDTRMQNARRNLEASKRRIRHMEEDLTKRESNSAAIVDAITENMLK